MQDLIQRFLNHLKTERNLSLGTIEAYGHDLGKFQEYLAREEGKEPAVQDIDRYTIRSFLTFLADKGYKKENTPVTRSRKLATLKSFFKFLYREGLIDHNPAAEVSMPKVNDKEPPHLTEEEYKRLIRTVSKTATPYYLKRDLAIISLLVGTGARLNELVSLNIEDINFQDGIIRLMRKGGQEQLLPLNDDVALAIKRYLRTKSKVSTNALFLSKRRRRIDRTSVNHLVKKYLEQARIKKDRLSPHTLRHTFATTLLAKGENLKNIQVLMNHKSLSTTAKYLHTQKQDLKKAVDKISLT